MQYFAIGASQRALAHHDFWIRRHLRCLIWRQWKRPATRFNKLRELGCPIMPALIANARRGPWWCAGVPALTQHLTPAYFERMGLFSLRQAVVTCD